MRAPNRWKLTAALIAALLLGGVWAGQVSAQDLLIKGGTVLTITGGDLPGTDVLVRDGKIARIGKDLSAPRGVRVIDAAGRFVMPAIIDDHSHMGIDRGINEGSRAVVPEADISDVIAHDDPSFFTALAGGVGVIHTMHGSANPIGGRNEVIKLKWGRPWGELVFGGAKPTLKFALGENVRQSRSSDPTRFPRSRSGVAEILREAFTKAQDYRRAWEEYEEAKKQRGADPIPPKRDLQLEVLVDVLEGEVVPRCHTYRADETIMFMEVCEEFGIPPGTFEHVLAGYMIAPELAEKGWGSSIFADSWGYKIEAYDAIPYKAAIMHKAGARVDMNSDSGERVRRLYQEAARAVRYGGVPENEALKMVTLNPAANLHLQDRLGSIEVGKDGTLAIFSHYPLHAPARCEVTIIDGEVFFDRSLTDTADSWVEGFSGTQVPEDEERYPGRPDIDFALTDTSVDDYALVGGTVVPVTGPAIPGGTVLIRDGRIAAVGRDVTVPSDVERIDVSGRFVYPGLIDAGTGAGLEEAGGMAGAADRFEIGDYNPHLEAYIAVNMASEMLQSQRVGGITTVVTGLTSGVIPGYDSLVDLWGWTPSGMTQKARAGLRINWGGRGRGRRGGPSGERAEELRRWFREAKAYAVRREMASRGELPGFRNDLRMDGLADAASGEELVIIEAGSEDQIREAVGFAEEMGLRYVIRGARDAWKMTDFLSEHGVKLIFGGVHASPGREEPYDVHFAAPAILHEAGIDFALMSGSTANIFSVTYEAGMATAFGLPSEKALEMLTIAPARILGMEEELGSIEVGKTANLIVTTGNPIAYTTQVHMMFIRGVKVPWDDKFSRHWRKYGARNR
ncbi:MAG: amidohydrolase family protein [bacterium]